MWQAFIDESGTDERWPCVCVGAYAGDEAEWRVFETDWKLVLHDAGLALFHATDNRCDTLKPALANAIESRKLIGYAFSIPKSHYRRLAVGRIRQTLGNAYAQAAIGVVLKIARQANEGKRGPVDFYIEAGQPNAAFVKQQLEALTDDYFAIGTVRTVQKRDHVPLQAADFLAHSFGVHDTPWLERLVGEGYGKALHCHYEGDQITDMSTQCEDIWRRYRRMKDQEKAERRKVRANQTL